MRRVESLSIVGSSRYWSGWAILFALAVGATLLALVLARYSALSSNVADLGFFSTNLVNIGTEWPRAFYGHAQPLMFLWGDGYQALPADIAPQMLLALQTLLLLGSVAAVWWEFGAWPGMAMLLYYPLWANALFDFHFDHLAVPLLTAFFIACERRKYGWAAVAAGALILVKEPFALQTAACGLYLGWLAFCLRGQGGGTRLFVMGMGLVLLGGAVFFALTNWLIPYFADDSGRFALSSGAFSWLGYSLADTVWTLLSRPGTVLAEMFGVPGKLVYLTVIFGLLAFVPLLRPAALMVALPLLMIALLSRLDNYYSYANHYTAGVIVPAIVAFRDGLPVARRYFFVLLGWMQRGMRCCMGWMNSHFRGNHKLVVSGRRDGVAGVQGRLGWSVGREQAVFSILLIAWLVTGHWALASSPISRLFWSDKVWSYSWQAYVPTERTAMMKQAMLDYIPADPEISVSTQNTVNWHHLAHRQVYLSFPMGIAEPQKVVDWSNRSWEGLWEFMRTSHKPPAVTHDRFADYVVLDLKRPYFLVDKGCEWLYGECRDKAMEDKFLGWVAYTQRRYATIYEKDGFMILKRQSSVAG